MRFRIITITITLTLSIASNAQISSLCQADTLPGYGAVGIISDIENDSAQQGQFLDWSTTLGNFSDIATITQQELQAKMSNETNVEKNLTKNGKTLRLPSYIDENGIDLYMLTDEGISIYMALLAPAYWQETSPDIIKWIRFYAWNNRERTRKIFKRYSAWEEYIKETFHSRGIPEEIAELCIVESGCTYKAKSSAGALGMWQIMPETARAWGMTVNAQKDDRTDPIKSTKVAAKILADNYRIVKDWTLCIAGYNCGMGRINSTITKANSRYWPTVKPYLPQETQQYIPSLLAVHYVWNYREELGL